MACTREQLLETAQAFIKSYDTWTMDAIMKHRSPDCVHRILPQSRNQPPRNNDEYREYFTVVMPLFQNFTTMVNEDEIFVDAEKRKVYMHITSRADTAIGVYENEYAMVVKMAEKGNSVQEVWEFVDSAYSSSFIPRLLKTAK